MVAMTVGVHNQFVLQGSHTRVAVRGDACTDAAPSRFPYYLHNVLQGMGRFRGRRWHPGKGLLPLTWVGDQSQTKQMKI